MSAEPRLFNPFQARQKRCSDSLARSRTLAFQPYFFFKKKNQGGKPVTRVRIPVGASCFSFLLGAQPEMATTSSSRIGRTCSGISIASTPKKQKRKEKISPKAEGAEEGHRFLCRSSQEAQGESRRLLRLSLNCQAAWAAARRLRIAGWADRGAARP